MSHFIPSLVLTSEYSFYCLRVQPLFILPAHLGSQLSRFTMPIIIMSIVMSSRDQKRFEILIHLEPLTYSGVVDKHSYNFLIDYCRKSHNLGLLESHGITYTTYYFRDVAINW